MKLRNKRTGEIVEVESCNSLTGTIGLFFAEGRECGRAYRSLAELNEEWEDYHEEPKEHWYFDTYDGKIYRDGIGCEEKWIQHQIEIGNYFETKEEAERAIEKLKAWKRLKDKGFKFEGIKEDFTRILQQNPFRTGKRYLQFNKSEDEDWMKENWNDLDLLFGEEEE